MRIQVVSNIITRFRDLRELRLTWKEMENLIFGRFIRLFGDILEDFWRVFEVF